jgi:RNA polymerase sigma factor (sigma-70 family)
MLMYRNIFVENIKNGDRQAIEVFVNENKKQVFSTCLAYLQNEQDAADLTQEVFIRALDKISQYKGESKISTWIVRIAINLSLNYLRDNKKRIQQVDLSNVQIPESVRITAQNRETKVAIRKAIYELPEKQRRVFILSFYLNHSYSEIAEITNTSISSVESLLFRARKNLRKLLLEFYKNK